MRTFYDSVELWVFPPPDNRIYVGCRREAEEKVRLATASTAPVVEFVREAVEGGGLWSWLRKPWLLDAKEEAVQLQ